MIDEQIFELAEKNGFQDDFGRWNFTNEELLDFVHELRQALAEYANSTTDFVEPKALSQTEQEPVAWVLHGELFWPSEYEVISEAGDNAIPLYTAPPKREWVGLTDEERHDIREWQEIQKELGPVWAPMMLYLYVAIEAKLKEKNG